MASSAATRRLTVAAIQMERRGFRRQQRQMRAIRPAAHLGDRSSLLIRRRDPPSSLASVGFTVFNSATAHLATAGPAGTPSTLEGAPGAERLAPAHTPPARPDEAAGRAAAAALWRDPFRRQRARYGHGAGFRWWHRLGAGAALLALIGVLGVLLAALVGFLAFVGGIALEAVIG